MENSLILFYALLGDILLFPQAGPLVTTGPISLKPYDVTPCLPCCIVGLFGGKLGF